MSAYNVVTVIAVEQHFESRSEEQRIPKEKNGVKPKPVGWNSYGYTETDTEYIFTRSEPMLDQPYYVATLKSAVNARMMAFARNPDEIKFGNDYIGPKAQSPRQAVMGLLDSMALAEKSAAR